MKVGHEVLHHGLATDSIKTTVFDLPWRSIILFNLLLLISAPPAYRLSDSVHEIGHLIAARALGGDIYGFFLRPVFSGDLSHGLPAGMAFSTIYRTGNLPEVLKNLGGVIAQLMTGGVALLLLWRVRGTSPWRIFWILYAGISILTALAYPLGGYYTDYGDFSGWRDALPWIGPLLCMTALFLIGTAAFLLGKSYLKTQSHWVPDESASQRVLIVFFTIGIFGFYFLPALGRLMRESIPAVGTLVFGIAVGGLITLLRSKPESNRRPRFPLRHAMFLVVLIFAVETFLTAHEGNILFEKTKYPESHPGKYEDNRVVGLEGRFPRIDLGEDGDLYWVDTQDGTLHRYRFGSGELTVLSSDLERPLRLKTCETGIYILERGGDPETGRIRFYEFDTGNLRVILEGIENPEGLDVDQNGDIYFTEKFTHVCVLKKGSSKKTVLRDDLPRGFSDVAVDAMGNLYVGTSCYGRQAEVGSLFRLSKDGRKKELTASGLSTPRELDVDGKGNVYIAGAGYSSITFIPKENGSGPVSLRGCLNVWCLAVSKRGDIYYSPGETARSEIRVLRRKDGV